MADPFIPKEALDFFKRKKLKVGFDYRDVWKEEHNHTFTVAKAMQVDLLTDIHDSLKTALAEGQTYRKWASQLQPILEQKGWWGQSQMQDPSTDKIRQVQLGSPRRLKVIYETNLDTAHAAGQWERIERNKESHPYLLYQLGSSKEHRPEHAQWHGILLPVDDPFWNTHRPKNGWGCKCYTRSIVRNEYARLKGQPGIATTAPRITYREWINKRTGEVERVPVGIDPGWDYNPGKRGERTANMLHQLNSKLAGAPQAMSAAAIRNLVESETFANWYQKPVGDWPVGFIKATDLVRIGANKPVAVLSSDTAKKQQREHPEITAAEYRHIQTTLESGWSVQDGEKVLIYVHESAGYVTVVKSTKTGQAMFVTSFRRLSGDQAKRDSEVQRLRAKEGK